MRKTSLLFSILLFSLSTNGCVEKNITSSSTQETGAIIATSTETPPPKVIIAASSAGEQHLLQTVQGPLLTVQERSNGFVFPQYKDKVILLQIFGQDCPYCFKEMPIINSIKRKYAGNLQIIALQAQEPMSKETSSKLIQEFQMDYPIIDKEESRSLFNFIQNTYGWMGVLPYMLIIKNGVTEYSFSGQVSHQELDEAVQNLI